MSISSKQRVLQELFWGEKKEKKKLVDVVWVVVFFLFFRKSILLQKKREELCVLFGRFSIIMYDSCCPILLIPLLLR